MGYLGLGTQAGAGTSNLDFQGHRGALGYPGLWGTQAGAGTSKPNFQGQFYRSEVRTPSRFALFGEYTLYLVSLICAPQDKRAHTYVPMCLLFGVNALLGQVLPEPAGDK